MKEAPTRFPEFHAEVVKALEHKAVQSTPLYMQQSAPKLLKMKLDTMPMHQDPLPDRFGRCRRRRGQGASRQAAAASAFREDSP